jgi:hypothetical protein
MFEMFEALYMEPADPTIPYRYAQACADSEVKLKAAINA